MKIRFLPFQPHCFCFGGFEIQMLSTLEAVQKLRVDAQKMDPWSQDCDFNILHLWGLELANYHNIVFAKKYRKKVVLTALLAYMYETVDILKLWISSYIGTEKFRKRMLQMVDALVVVNDMQYKMAKRYYRFPENKIYIIPNIVHELYWNSINSFDSSFLEKYNVQNYILTTGNVCKRKNQLNLALACVKQNLNLVIIGNLLGGEEEYGEELSKIIETSSNITWIKALPPNSSGLISAYQNCSFFALPSHSETQPISALEAAVLGKPLLLGNKFYAKQKYYQNAYLVNPGSVDDIAAGLKVVTLNRDRYKPPRTLINECNRKEVAKMYVQIYDKLND